MQKLFKDLLNEITLRWVAGQLQKKYFESHY